MADGDKWSLNRIACTYTLDDHSTCRFRVLERYQSQAELGWSTAGESTTKPPWRGLKPRSFLTYDSGDHSQRRRVAVGTNGAYYSALPFTTTVAVQNPTTDVEDTFTLYGKEGERFRGVELD